MNSSDLMELGLTEKGSRCSLVVLDYFAKFAEAYSIPDKTVDIVSRVLFESRICDGCKWPKRIHSDQGQEFVNGTFSDICEKRLSGSL